MDKNNNIGFVTTKKGDPLSLSRSLTTSKRPPTETDYQDGDCPDNDVELLEALDSKYYL